MIGKKATSAGTATLILIAGVAGLAGQETECGMCEDVSEEFFEEICYPYSWQSCHYWTETTYDHDRGNDTHEELFGDPFTELGNEWCGYPHHSCDPHLLASVIEPLSEAVKLRDAAVLDHLIKAAAASAIVEYHTARSAVQILATCSEDQKPRVVASIAVDPRESAYWAPAVVAGVRRQTNRKAR